MKTLKSDGRTHVGMKRDHNEDAFFCSDELGLYLVADGMGGHAYGEVASALAVENISREIQDLHRMRTPFFIRDVIQRANFRIFQTSTEKSASQRGYIEPQSMMGTTVVALYIAQETVTVAHVGDSRAYRFRNGRLEPLTQDHSLAATIQGYQNGSFADTRFKNVITRALGLEPNIEIDVREEKVLANDLFLLCSDGLTNMVQEERIHEILGLDYSLGAVCDLLIDEANRNGGKDNISCVLVQYT